MSIFTQTEEIACTYGVYFVFDDSVLQMLNELHKCNARKKVDICIKYRGIAKEFSLTEFLSLLGFSQADHVGGWHLGSDVAWEEYEQQSG